MPGTKRASVDDKDVVDEGRAAKRSRGSESPSIRQDSPADLLPTDELGFETETPPSTALMASSERCEAAWNEFVAARGSSDDASNNPADLEGRPDDVRGFVRRNGVGATSRAKLWMCWSGAMDRMLCSSRPYEEEVRLAKEAAAPSSSSPRGDGSDGGDGSSPLAKDSMCAHAAQIELDLQRTFPNHADFRMEGKGSPGGNGRKLEPLRRVLLALAHSHPEVGYTQGMNFVAGWCLLVLDGDETSTYWLMSALLEDVLAGYFNPGLSALREDLDLLDADFCIAAPAAHLRLADMGCLVKYFCPRWLLCVMVGTAPTAVTLRVWDIILVDSDRRPRDILRRCALAALELQVPFLLAAPGMGEAVEAIRSAGSSVDNVDAFLLKVRDTPRRDAAAAKAAAAAAAAAERENQRGAAAAAGGLSSPPPAARGSAMKPPLKTPSRLKTFNPFASAAGVAAAGGPPPTALRPALTPFGNLLSMFQPTPRKTAVKPRNLWGGGGGGGVENANPAAPAPTPMRTKSTPARWAPTSSAAAAAANINNNNNFTADAVSSPTYSNATPFRGTGSVMKHRGAVEVEPPNANLIAAAEALGVTLVGHSVSFSGVGGVNGSDGVGSRGGNDMVGAGAGRGGDGGNSNCPAAANEMRDIELQDFNSKKRQTLRSPLGTLSRRGGVDENINNRTPKTRRRDSGGTKRLISGSGPMALWTSPEEKAGDIGGGGGGGVSFEDDVENVNVTTARKALGRWGKTPSRSSVGDGYNGYDSPVRSPAPRKNANAGGGGARGTPGQGAAGATMRSPLMMSPSGRSRGAAFDLRSPLGLKSPIAARSPVVKMR